MNNKLALLPPIAFVLATSIATAQHGSAEKYSPEELYQHFRNSAAEYRITSGEQEYVLQKQPLMHWQNPTRLQEQGAVFIWNQNGRPTAMASIFTFVDAGRTFCRHECISLSESAFEASLDSKIVWAPDKPGLTWKTVSAARQPGNSASRRLVQFRSIARTFSGKLMAPGSPPSRLKLVPQPLHRYSSEEAGIIDGAIFAMAVATDPEIFLVIEAFETNGEQNWRYAAVRSHFWGVELQKDEQVVWKQPSVEELSVTNAGQLPWMREPYFTFFESQAIPSPETLR